MGGAPLSLVIFDCDGVLIDSETICAAAHAEALQRLGIPLGYDDLIRRFTGVPDRAMYAVIEREFCCALPADYDEKVSRAIRARFATDLRALPGVHEAVAAIDLPVCVASSAAHDKLKFALSVVGLYDRFAPNIFSADEVASGKPAPDLFLHAARRMDADPGHCLVIEDSIAGVTAAVAAGMRVVGFCGAAHCDVAHAAALAATGAAAVFADLAQLPAIVDSVRRGLGG
jgi:HAD superfamily hydrolase (TIGR01509 family)